MARRPWLLRPRSLGGHDARGRVLRQRWPLDRCDAAAGVLLAIWAADHRSARTGVWRPAATAGLLRSSPATAGLLRLTGPLGLAAAAVRSASSTTGLLRRRGSLDRPAAAAAG